MVGGGDDASGALVSAMAAPLSFSYASSCCCCCCSVMRRCRCTCNCWWRTIIKANQARSSRPTKPCQTKLRKLRPPPPLLLLLLLLLLLPFFEQFLAEPGSNRQRNSGTNEATETVTVTCVWWKGSVSAGFLVKGGSVCCCCFTSCCFTCCCCCYYDCREREREKKEIE